jgi:hypothetical protein
MTDSQRSYTGGCLCGGVRYTVRGALRDVIACHCSMCRITSGHFAAMTSARSADLHLDADDTLSWYRSSETAERGFCNRCGSNLFWRPTAAGNEVTSITAGTLKTPTGLKIAEHIFVAEQSDYYRISDDAPQKQYWT